MVVVTIFGFLPRDNVTNIFLANQSISDLMVIVFVLPISVGTRFVDCFHIWNASVLPSCVVLTWDKRNGQKVWLNTKKHLSFSRYAFLSDYLTDLKLHINFIKTCPQCWQWGWNLGPPDHEANALPTELGRNLLGRRFLKWALFVSCTISHVGLCSFLESIEHDFIKAMKIQAGNWMLT